MRYDDIPEIEGFKKIPLGKAKNNLVGYTNNHLTALYRTENVGSSRDPMWVCQCDCGKITTARARDILSGRKKSCGHIIYNMSLAGKKVGKLTIIEPTELRSNTCVKWKCLCDCGNICYISSHHLIDANAKQTLSCGCLRLENAHSRDITNMRFGKLVALYPLNIRKNDCVVWHCKCDCGNFIDVDLGQLTRGKIKSCGCLSLSFGEYEIEQLLLKNNLSYQKQARFAECKDIYCLPFDFLIGNAINFYLIEFDGIQHYEAKEYFGGDEGFQLRQKHDQMKNQYCKDNNIPLIRIPYTAYDTLSIDDLKLETTQYRVV